MKKNNEIISSTAVLDERIAKCTDALQEKFSE